MSFIRCLGSGMRRARRRPGLVLLLYLASLAPALYLVFLVGGAMAPVLDRSLSADRILQGQGLVVFQDYMYSSEAELGPLFSPGVPLMLALAAVLQILAAAGAVETLLDRGQSGPRPFLRGIGRNGWRFTRSALIFIAVLALAACAAGFVFSLLGNVAEERGDGRFDLAGAAAAGVLFFLLLGPLDLAYDLSRIAGARHDAGRMLHGMLRALGAVLRRPKLFAPLYLSFLVLPLLLHAMYYFAVRRPWTPDSATAVAGLLVIQQIVMITRAYLRTAFWGAEIHCYERLGEPDWCGGRRRDGYPAPPP